MIVSLFMCVLFYILFHVQGLHFCVCYVLNQPRSQAFFFFFFFFLNGPGNETNSEYIYAILIFYFIIMQGHIKYELSWTFQSRFVLCHQQS